MRKTHMAISLNNLKPIQLDEAQAQALQKAVESQDVSRRTPKSMDEENFPVFETIVNDGALVYIPNFSQGTNPKTGRKILRKEHAYIHAVSLETQYLSVRSTQNLRGLEKVGISGEDPLTAAVQKNWDLYNILIEASAKELGVPVQDKENEALKGARRKLIDNFTVKQANEYYAFPIVVIETQIIDGAHQPRKIVLDKDKKPKFKVYWFQISERRFSTLFETAEMSMEEGDYVGGNFWHFNYDTGKPTEELKNAKMASGLAFKPVMLNFKNITEETKKMFDDAAEAFTPAKARETIIAMMLQTDEAHQVIADEAVRPVQDKLETLELAKAATQAGASKPAVAQGAEAQLEQFGADTAQIAAPYATNAPATADANIAEDTIDPQAF